MSGDVQPKRRKDKDKKKKKAQPEGSTDDMGSEDPVKQFLIVDDEDGGDLPPGGDSSHEVHDDHHGHGSASMCGRIVFLTLFVALLVGVFAVFCESWGKSNTEVSIKESRFAELFRGFVEDVDEHEHEDDHLPHASHDDDEEEGEEESSHQPWQEEVRSAQQTRSATTDPPVPEPEVEPSTILAGVTESRLAADAKTHFDGLRTEPLDASSSMGMKSVVESSEKKVEPEAVQGQATELLKTVQVELSSSTLGRDVPSYLTLETSGEIHAEDDDSLLSYLSSSSVPPEPVDEPLFTQSTWSLSGTEPEVLESVEKLPEEQVDDQPVEQVNEQQSDEGYESDRESPPEHPDVHFEQSDEVIEKHVPTVQAPPVIEISEAVDEVEHVEEPKPVVEEPEIEHVEQVEFDKPEPHQEAKNVEDPAVSVVEHRVIEPKEVPEKHVEPLEHIEIEHVSVEEPQIVDNVLPQVEENVVEHEPVLQDLNEIPEVPARSVEASVEEEKSPVHSPEPERVVIEPELDQHAQVEERTEVPSLEPEPLVEEPEIEPRESPWDRYEFRDITNEDDFEVREELDELDRLYAQAKEGPELRKVMEKFQEILKKKPHSPRSMFMIGLCLDRLAFYEKSNALLDESITIMTKAVTLGPYVPDELARRILRTLYDKMKFRGHIFKGIPILLKAVERFPNEREWRHYLIVAYLTLGRNDDARLILQESLRTWPDDGFAKVHYGFLLKLVDKNYKAAARYMQDGIDTRDPGTLDGRFFYHLGDAYMRLGNAEKEAAIYKQGKKEGLFLSEMQRSLHNVDRLTGRPWWTKEQTGYKQDLDKMSAEWRIIRKEGLNALALKKNGFKDESETLKDKGDWKEFMLWARGKKVEENCKKAPLTCGMVEKFKAASSCKQGQVKFSVMKPGTHVWAHTGPTNARIRAHLGLAGVPGAKIRVGNETREWIEGDFIVFDDSFEHEVWHEGEKTRLVLIVDMWHPELTDDEKANLSPI